MNDEIHFFKCTSRRIVQKKVHPVRVFFVINGVQIKDARDDCAGNVARNERIQLGPRMPAIDAAELPWASSIGRNPEARRALIQSVIKANPTMALAETVVCNTFEALPRLPKPALAIGPLEVPLSTTSAACHFWPEDRACLTWLDAQAPGSVVYVAFGSLTVFDATRLQELADGLVLTGRPFVWVVRPNFAAGIGSTSSSAALAARG
jgi:hypothetical protein